MKVEAVPQALILLDSWVNQLAGRLPPPVKVPVPGFDFRWQYPEETPRVLLVCKCVRLSTSLGGAWELAKLGSSTESGSLLRQVGDFAGEIWFLVEGITRGKFTKSQTQFISQFFDPIATTVEEYLEKEKSYYVRRGEMTKADRRLTELSGLDAESVSTVSSYLGYGFNKYVHGAYETAMELYHGGTGRFMILRGEGRTRGAAMQIVASKATEACLAVRAAALVLGAPQIQDEVKAFLDDADPYLEVNPASADDV